MTGYKPFFPPQAYPLLYADVIRHQLYPDSKTFLDTFSRIPPKQIAALYQQVDRNDPEQIKNFISRMFEFTNRENYSPPEATTIHQHLHQLWEHLIQLPDLVYQYSSLIPLPHSYVISAGSFREISYWDSYFTMLGLRVSGREEIIYDMVSNFAWLLGQIGHIPQGNRSYYLSRSQPPFFALMVELLAEIEDESIYTKFLPELLVEYWFWMDQENSDGLVHRAVSLDGNDLNRYYDELDEPRPEFYAEDLELNSENKEIHNLYRNIRAACESGWSLSSRWLNEKYELSSIHTTDIIPVELNSLLFLLEQCIARAHEISGNSEAAIHFQEAAQRRIDSMNRFLWNDTEGYFADYNFSKKQFGSSSLASMYPLFAGIATPQQAERTIEYISQHFLRSGGWVTSEHLSGYQWDAPYGWAQLQWITWVGLKNYGADTLAEEGAMRWLMLNKKVYDRTGCMMEKYNVEDLSNEEIDTDIKDGFGWTNGVFLALQNQIIAGMKE